jgi:alkylation response protein AidB-like acyl-CoA dehydrogenase
MQTDEQLQIQALAREFARAELRPRAAEWDADRALPDDVFNQLAELGFLGMLVPEEHGGLGFDLPTYLSVLEELAAGDASVAFAVAVHNGPVATLLGRHASEEQKRRWLPALASGEALGAFALSEPGAGSDIGAVRTRAVPEGDGWLLRGHKRWVTNGGRAGLVIVFAKVGDTPDSGVGAFVVRPPCRGFEVGRRERTLGLRASETVSVTLEDVVVGAENLVGDPEAGLDYALEALDQGRVECAAQAVGIGRAALEHATAYALEREQFDRPIARFGAIQEKLARMAERLAAAQALTREAVAAVAASGEGGSSRQGLAGSTARAAIAKVVASESATWIADEAIQVFGGYGYMRHYPVERLLRDAKGTEIFEGTNEIMRHVIARELLRDAGEGSG